MAKIAVDNTHNTPRHGPHLPCGSQTTQPLAAGDGWSIHQVVCTAGPKDRAFEEQHSQMSVAVVLRGTFQYRTSTGTALMIPGSLLLGNAGDSFECSHQDGMGDRCISFHYAKEFCEFAELSTKQQFRIPRIPTLRALAPLAATASMLLWNDIDHALFQETAFQILDRATHMDQGSGARREANSTPGRASPVGAISGKGKAQPLPLSPLF